MSTSRRLFLALLVVAVTMSPMLSSADWEHAGNNADIRAMLAVDDLLWVGTNGGLILFTSMPNRNSMWPRTSFGEDISYPKGDGRA